MLTSEEFERVIDNIRKGFSMRDALAKEDKVLDSKTQSWFLENPDITSKEENVK